MQIIVSGVIGGKGLNYVTGLINGITFDEVVSMTRDFKGNEIDVIISSNGGGVDSSNSIHDILKGHKASVTTTIVGAARSAATRLSMSADEGKKRMTKSAKYFIHEVQAEIIGSLSQAKNDIRNMEVHNEQIISDYVELTGLSREDISLMMKNETEMNAETALALGFIDEIVDAVDISNYSEPIQQEFQNSFGMNSKQNIQDKETGLPKGAQEKINNFLNNSKSIKMDAIKELQTSMKNGFEALQNSLSGLIFTNGKNEEVNVTGTEAITNSITSLQNSFIAEMAKVNEGITNQVESAIAKKLDGLEIENLKTIKVEDLATKSEVENISEPMKSIENAMTEMAKAVNQLTGKENEFQEETIETPTKVIENNHVKGGKRTLSTKSKY